MNSLGAQRLAHSGLVSHAHSTVRATARRWLATLSLGLLGAAASAGWQQAQATQVVWSVGFGTPGAVVHVANHPAPRVVYPPVYQTVPVQVVVAPPPRWYGPHTGAGHGHHHRDYFDDHRRGNRHHGWRSERRGGQHVYPVDPRWDNHHRR